MNEFFIFLFFVFFVIPIFKNIFGGGAKKTKKKNNYGKSHNQIKRQVNARAHASVNAHGHSDAKRRTHQQLHRGDNSSVFPEDHQDRVRARDIRDTQKFKIMEKVTHGRNNRGVVQASNKSRADWGARGDKELLSLSNVVKLIVLVAIAYAVVNRFFPEILR